MEKTKLSGEGQVAIPKGMQKSLGWESGQDLLLEETPDGLLLRSFHPLPETFLEEVVGCLPYKGPAKSLEEMEQAIAEGIRETYGSH